MNPKTKIKVAIDVAMTALFLVLMNLAWTGLVWHEMLGLAILVFFIVHLLVNRQWISSVTRRILTIESRKTRLMFILNALLGLAMLMTVISGVLISQHLFPGLADSSFDLWFSIHEIASWLSLGIVIVHIAIHWRWISSVIRRLALTGSPRILAGRLRVFAARATLGIIAAVTIYSLVNGQLTDLLLPVKISDPISDSSDDHGTTGTSSTLIVAADETGTTTVTLQPTPGPTAAEPEVTLLQYLSSLTCTACRKHCLLSSPRCARGVRQADAAETYYYEALENGSL